MTKSARTLRTCKKGHAYYKSSDCPTCPVCEKEKRPADGFLSLLASPARNSLQYHGIDTLEKLSTYTETEILALHGLGKASIPILQSELKKNGMDFRK